MYPVLSLLNKQSINLSSQTFTASYDFDSHQEIKLASLQLLRAQFDKWKGMNSEVHLEAVQ